jgi:histone acetyltransferase MYST1
MTNSDTSETFKIGDIVSFFCEDLESNQTGRILAFRSPNEAYIHVIDQDNRLEDWYNIDQLTIITNSTDEIPDLQPEVSLGNVDGSSEQFHIRNIESITLGLHRIRTWYYSPYPPPYQFSQHLFICEHCFFYFSTQESLRIHLDSTKEFQPPGREIYRSNTISIFELLGKEMKLACQSLSLVGKFFLNEKKNIYDIENMAFYILCELNNEKLHSVGYFSRDVAIDNKCIMNSLVVFPPYQRRGFGKMLISLSYEIVKRRGLLGQLEGPLSDMGRAVFQSYWRDAILRELMQDPRARVTIDTLVEDTAIAKKDIVETLRILKLVKKVRHDWRLTRPPSRLPMLIRPYQVGNGMPVLDFTMLNWVPRTEAIQEEEEDEDEEPKQQARTRR